MNAGGFHFLPPQKSERPYSVSEINRGVARILEEGNTLVWVQGEISNFKRASSGHCYLTLKDQDSQISAVIWRSTASALTFGPETGLEVIVIASLRVYQKGGSYQLDIHKMQPSRQGELFARFEELKRRLEAEGLFDPARKRQLPTTVRRLGVITSKQGAAIRDIIKVVSSRAPQTDIVLIDTAVQGERAPEQIARAIADMNAYAHVDCMIVGRGGGSMEDLWAFNSEEVARAIFASAIPVISAVGHEIDFTIADFVADVRAPTPSAAAEMAVPDTRESARYFESLSSRFAYHFQRYWSGLHDRYRRVISRPALRKPLRLVGDNRQTLDDLHDRCLRNLEARFAGFRRRVTQTAAHLQAVSPLKILSRGYSVVSRTDGTTVKDAGLLTKGDEIRIRFHQGRAQAAVTGVSGEQEPAA